MPHTRVRQSHGGISGAPRGVCETLEGGGAPGISRLVLPDADLWAHGCRECATPGRITIVRGTSCRSAGIDKGPGRGPHTHDDLHRYATGRTADHERGRGLALCRLVLAGVSLPDQEADGRERDGTAGMEKAEMPDFHEALGQDMLEEPAEKFHDIEVGGAGACTAHFPVGEGDRAGREADETVVGDGDFEDIGGEVGESRVAVMVGLTVDVPGDGPDLGGDVLQQSGLAHGFFEEGTIDGGEGFDGNKEVGSGGAPGRTVRGEATARDDVMDMRVILQLPAPGVEDAGETRKVGPDEALVLGQPLEGRCRRLKQGVVREALMRADEGSERLRDRKGEEEVRPRELLVQVVLEPLLGLMLLALGTVAVATGMIDAVLLATTLALIEAMAIMPALALLDGADDLAVCEGQLGVALQVFWSKGGKDIAQGGHGRSPCMRVLRRS